MGDVLWRCVSLLEGNGSSKEVFKAVLGWTRCQHGDRRGILCWRKWHGQGRLRNPFFEAKTSATKFDEHNRYRHTHTHMFIYLFVVYFFIEFFVYLYTSLSICLCTYVCMYLAY